jgi:CRP/FNR family cyclic AMP-dependent transcriptional regulator
MDWHAMLAESELFEGASPSDFEPLAQSAHKRNYGRGEFLWHTGDVADAMYLVLAGEVVVLRLGPGGEEYVVEAFISPDVMGQLHFFDQRPTRILDARAAAPTSCVVLPRDAVLRLLERKSHLMFSMLRAYSRWIRQRDLVGADGAFRNLTARVVTRLLQLSDRYGETSADGIQIRLHLTETTLANMLGASRENVSRALAVLLRSGVIRRERGAFVIARPDDLRRRYSWVSTDEARTIWLDRHNSQLGALRRSPSRNRSSSR